jgi:two-component system, LytTR family, sensor kinase
MHWHELFFSEEKKPKAIRHLAFWASWWTYFLLCFLLFNQPIPGKVKPFYLVPGEHLPLKTLLLILLYALTCYPLIYLILPRIISAQWLKAAAYIALLLAFLFLASNFLYWQVFPLLDALFGTSIKAPPLSRSWPAINLGLMNFIKVAAAAVTIKYIKYWWLKQKESQRLEKEKINAELELLKAQVHPDFLLKTLQNIYSHASASSPGTSGMLLKMSDLLSYMLYECDRPLVPLAKEIMMMKEYMQLEKISHHDTPEMEVSIKGALEDRVIAPFLLLPFIENSFMYCG